MTAAEREQLIAEALAEYLDTKARDEPVDAADFCAARPAIAEELAQEIAAASELDCLTSEDAAPAVAAEPRPASLSGYRILRELGAGGMGRVFLASDEALGREVAIKTLRPSFAADASLQERFLREARALARLTHPNIVRIYSLGGAKEVPHFVMEYVDGVPLTAAARTLTLRSQIELFRKVVLAVEFLHQNHLLHRDLKPANILVTPDLLPRLLDLGLALSLSDPRDLTMAGQVLGTPAYLSPEQAAGELNLDARSDVFSLGAILYEILTGAQPFPASNPERQLLAIRESDPVLPRRLNPNIPGALQNICLKALEKNPEDRYPTARAFAEDLDRFLAGEPVIAVPVAYSRLIATKRTQQLAEIAGWHADHLITDAEYENLRRGYEHLEERNDAWILEMRRLSLPHVSLYLGASILVVVSSVVATLRDSGLRGWPAFLTVALASVAACAPGVRLWRRGELRSGIAFLLAFCFLLPVALILLLMAMGVSATPVQGREWLAAMDPKEGWKPVTNSQIWWALLLSMPAYVWLRRFTSSSAFSMVLAAVCTGFSLVTLLRMGWLEWLEKDPGRFYLYLLPFAVLFFAAGVVLESRSKLLDSRYFYPIAVAFTYAGLSGVALFHEPYRNWLNTAFPWTRGQIEYLFLINAIVYFALQAICGRAPLAQVRKTGRAFRFVLPGHVLISLLLLDISVSGDAARVGEDHLFQVLLPLCAVFFVYFSIPKQMKNFFISGVFFLAIGLVRLQRGWLSGQGLWPTAFLAVGLALMFAAARYPVLKMTLLRRLKR